MDNRRCGDFKFESNSRIECKSPAHTIFRLVPMRLIKYPKLDEQCESLPLLDGLTLDIKVSCDTRWIFHRVSGWSRQVFRSSGVRFAFSLCNMLMSLKSVANLISSMTLLNIIATPHIVTTRIGSRPDVSNGYRCGGVVGIYMRRRGTELCLPSGCHCCS